MKICILTFGTRGDVQPYIALGLELQAAGHEVTIATPVAFRSFVLGYGLQHDTIRGDFLKAAQTAEAKSALKGRGNPLRLLLGPFNRLSHQLYAFIGPALYRRPINEWRREVLGLPPVYVGFGSMFMDGGARKTQIVLKALKLADQPFWGRVAALGVGPSPISGQ